MVYSKVLLGELPEIINEILLYLNDDYSTLYSCILVNRLWCRLAIPLLWSDPFSVSKYKKQLKHHFIDFYLYFFDENDKNKLKEEFGIDRINFISSPPLFDYPHFINALNTYKLDLIVSDWIDSFTEQLSKLHRKKGNSLHCNLPQAFMMHSLQLQSIRQQRAFLNNNSNENFQSFSSSSKNNSNNNKNVENKILPSPSRSNIFQRRRGIPNLPNSLPYPLPVDFKSLKREVEIPSKKISINANLNNSSNMIPLSAAFSSSQFIQRRSRRRRQIMIPSSITSVTQIPQDEKFEKLMKLKCFICYNLIKLFISYSASLITFEIIFRHKNIYSVIYNIYEMIKNNPKFIYKVENFTFHYSLPNHHIITIRNSESRMESILSLISYLPSLCNLIKNLKFQIVIPNFSLESSKILSKLVCSQQQLSKLTFTFNVNKEILQNSLSNLKNVANTLTCLIFDACQFINIQPFQSFQNLEYLENLESLQFFHCYPVLKPEIIQHILQIKNLKIKTLAIVNNISRGEINNVSQYQSLLLKIGSHLENLILSIDIDIKKNIFQDILQCCEKIKFIHFTKLNYDSIPELKNLINKFGETLRYITLDIDNESYTRVSFHSLEDHLNQNMKKTSTLLLQQLGQVLPSTLEYIDLFLIIDPKDLKIFLDNCKHIKLKRLLLRNSRDFYLDHTLQLLKDFIMNMNNSIQYFSYRIGRGADPLEWDLGGNELKEKEKAKEFEQYVKVRKYSDVVIRRSESFYNGSTSTYAL